MDDFEYSVQMSEQDWNAFFQECEECDLLPPVLAGLDDSGMSDFDEFGCNGPNRRSRQGRDMAEPGVDLKDRPLFEEPHMDRYMDRYGLRSPDYVLSGSEDDMHIDRSVNRFFEHLRSMTNTAEQSLKHPTATGKVKRTQATNRMDFNDEYPPIDRLPKTPLRVKKNQGAINSGDVKPKNEADSRLLAKPTGIPSKATTDWYARSRESASREEWPISQNKLEPMKEDGRDTAHNNNFSKDALPVQLRSSDTGAALSSDLAGCRHSAEVMWGDDAYGQAISRKSSEYPEGQSPCATPRRKKKRRKRMSMDPVEAGYSYEGQFMGVLTDSDEDRHSRRAEVEKPLWGSLPGEFGIVKMADKDSDPKRLSLQSTTLIDSLSDHLPVQANSRTWTDSMIGPRELSTAGSQAVSIDLPRAPPQGAYLSQSVKKTEPSCRSTDLSGERCSEEPPLSLSLQSLLKNSCKPVESPVSANAKKQTDTPTRILNNGVPTQCEGDKVLGNSTQTSSRAHQLEAQKSDQVPGCHSSVDPEGSRIANRPAIARSPPGSQVKTGQTLSQIRLMEGEGGHHHPSASQPQINNTSPIDPGKMSPQCANAQSDIRPKLVNGHSASAVEPTNKDSPGFSGTISDPVPGVQGANLQTSLLENNNNNKPSALPAHLYGPVAAAAAAAATAKCPPALGYTTTDKQMQIREESAEQADCGSDNTRSKQIITYPAESDPKGPAPCRVSLSSEAGDNKHGMPPMTYEQQKGLSDQLSAKMDSGMVRSDGKALYDLSKAVDATGNIALDSNCTDASSETGSGTHNDVSVLPKPITECSEPGNDPGQLQSLSASKAVVKESCKAISAQLSQSGEAAKPATDADSNTALQLPSEEDREDATPEKKDNNAMNPDPPPAFAMSSFWNEMEKLTINDILRLRMVSHAQHPSVLTPLGEDDLGEASHARDSGYFTHVDDTRPDRSSGDVSTMSDFDEEQLHDQEVPKQDVEEEEEVSVNPATNVLWVNEPDSPSAFAEAEDVLLLSTDTGIPQSLFAEQQYFRKMCKNISMQNLRALENQPLRQILRNASLQSLRSLDDNNSADPFYHIDTSAQFSDDESVDGHGFSLSEMIEYLFCDDDAKSTVSETENLMSSHISGNSVPETYDDFYTEFETSSLFFPENSSGPDSSKMLPIFSCSRASSRNSNSRNVQFPEAYDYFFPDSPPQSDNEEEREHSPPIRVVSRYHNKTSTLYNTTASADGVFWTSPLSLRRVRRKGLTVPPSQTTSFALVPVGGGKKTSRRPMQPFNVMGYEDQGSFPDPLLCDLESRIFRKLAEQQMRCPETTVVDPRVDAPLVPLKQSDMCLVCIAFASWVMKSVSPQGADTWKAVLLANISALSAIRYLRRYKYIRDEAAAAKTLHQSSQS